MTTPAEMASIASRNQAAPGNATAAAAVRAISSQRRSRQSESPWAHTPSYEFQNFLSGTARFQTSAFAGIPKQRQNHSSIRCEEHV